MGRSADCCRVPKTVAPMNDVRNIVESGSKDMHDDYLPNEEQFDDFSIRLVSRDDLSIARCLLLALDAVLTETA